MNRCLLGGCFAFVAGFVLSSSASANDELDLATQTQTIFAAKCVNCHGPNLAKPKGRFGYVLDLARVAANREMIVPGSPDESELWELVNRGDMPPADSPTGSLSQEQKAVIHNWISAGAPPATAAETKSLPALEQEPKGSPETPEPSFLKRTLGRLGAFHLLAIHFPIALLIAAAARELWGAWHGERRPSPTVRFCVILGAISAVVAAVLGWLHAWNGFGSAMPHSLLLHRWLGTAAALWGIGTAVFSESESRREARSNWFRAWLLFGCVLVAVAAHLGGTLVHGEDFLGIG
jgi:mono/diheme cytochrome c family protein